ncbi:MAG: DUF2461 domain-containing protein [Bacteroidales bacterium]|nr:DUF2461 domain-containing protein [Bacteroidales bacterium]
MQKTMGINMKRMLNFLDQLEQNNTKEWFNENRQLYEDARAEFKKLVTELIGRITMFDPELQSLTPKESIFRIHRDIRFSKDKTPYKTNFGAVLGKGGRKSPYAGYYVHIEPGASFLGGGSYHPGKDVLKKIREEIYFNPTEFQSIIHEPDFKKLFGNLMEFDALKRPPKDYPNDFEHINLLMYRSYIVGHNVPDRILLEQNPIEYAEAVYLTMKPFKDFINRALEG